MSAYNEDAYENAIVQLFVQIGWEHVYGPDVERNWHSPLYDSVLEASVRRPPKSTRPTCRREQTDASEAYLQIRNYIQEIPSMFICNCICVMSDQLTSLLF